MRRATNYGRRLTVRLGERDYQRLVDLADSSPDGDQDSSPAAMARTCLLAGIGVVRERRRGRSRRAAAR